MLLRPAPPPISFILFFTRSFFVFPFIQSDSPFLYYYFHSYVPSPPYSPFFMSHFHSSSPFSFPLLVPLFFILSSFLSITLCLFFLSSTFSSSLSNLTYSYLSSLNYNLSLPLHTYLSPVSSYLLYYSFDSFIISSASPLLCTFS